MDCRVKTLCNTFVSTSIFNVSILDLMDCRVKTMDKSDHWKSAVLVSILDLMDCRVKTNTSIPYFPVPHGFQSLI